MLGLLLLGILRALEVKLKLPLVLLDEEEEPEEEGPSLGSLGLLALGFTEEGGCLFLG